MDRRPGRPARRPRPATCIPASPTGGYDVRDVARSIVDDGDLLELRAHWAPNLVTGLATIGGRPVGIVANQPVSIAGTLDIPASQKGARFVSFCDALGLPLLTLVDTPGFYPGKDLEWRGMIRHGAQLAFAYARATVPRVAVVLRKAYGGAYIVMDCRSMGMRPVPGVAVGRDRRDGGQGRGRDPAPPGVARAPGRAARRPTRSASSTRTWPPTGLRRRGHRSGRHPPRGGRRLRPARHQARDPRRAASTTTPRCRS